jgi:hypothetical protein
MKYRLAKSGDCTALVDIHFAIRDIYSVGIFAKLGKPFLKRYYKIIIKDPNSVIVCAEDEQGVIQGFCSSTLDVGAQMTNIKKHRIILGISAITSFLGNPSLFKHLVDRYRVLGNNSEKKIISKKGARSEYWVWSGSSKDAESSVEMYFAQLNILKSLGVTELFGEVDLENKRILKFQLANGNEIVEHLTLPDGRRRVILRLDLAKWNNRV